MRRAVWRQHWRWFDAVPAIDNRYVRVRSRVRMFSLHAVQPKFAAKAGHRWLGYRDNSRLGGSGHRAHLLMLSTRAIVPRTSVVVGWKSQQLSLKRLFQWQADRRARPLNSIPLPTLVRTLAFNPTWTKSRATESARAEYRQRFFLGVGIEISV